MQTPSELPTPVSCSTSVPSPNVSRISSSDIAKVRQIVFHPFCKARLSLMFTILPLLSLMMSWMSLDVSSSRMQSTRRTSLSYLNDVGRILPVDSFHLSADVELAVLGQVILAHDARQTERAVAVLADGERIVNLALYLFTATQLLVHEIATRQKVAVDDVFSIVGRVVDCHVGQRPKQRVVSKSCKITNKKTV